MNQENIVVIHGFNSGPGGKAEVLKENFPSVPIFNPQLDNDPFNDLKLLQDFINNNSNIHVVGTSLGGFYALYLAMDNKHRDDISYYLINPSITPYDSFSLKLGQSFKNYKSGGIFHVDEEFIESLFQAQLMVHFNFEVLPNMYFYFGEQDEVINHNKLKQIIYSTCKPYNVFESDQDHRHDDISTVIKHIKENMVL